MLLNRNHLIPGFLVAGVCGACVSVLLKFPHVMDYGENVTTMLGIFGRVVTGALASMIGFGFLASGTISFNFTFDGQPKSIGAIIKNFNTPDGSSTLYLLVILSLALLFGFSERLFSSFESTLLGKLFSRENHSSDKVNRKGKSRQNEKCLISSEGSQSN